MLAATRNQSINRLRDHNRHVLWHLGTVHLDGDIRISLLTAATFEWNCSSRTLTFSSVSSDLFTKRARISSSFGRFSE